MITYHLRLIRGRKWVLTRDNEKAPVHTYNNATRQTAVAQAVMQLARTGGHLRIYHRNGLFASEQFFESPDTVKRESSGADREKQAAGSSKPANTPAAGPLRG